MSTDLTGLFVQESHDTNLGSWVSKHKMYLCAMAPPWKRDFNGQPYVRVNRLLEVYKLIFLMSVFEKLNKFDAFYVENIRCYEQDLIKENAGSF